MAASSFSLSSDGSCPASGTASSGAGAGAAEGAAEGAAAVAARLAEFSLVNVNLRQVFYCICNVVAERVEITDVN